MYPYLNFCKHLRSKYGRSLGITAIPNHQFKMEMGGYLHIGSEEGYYQAIREMKLYGLIRLRNTHVEIVNLLD